MENEAAHAFDYLRQALIFLVCAGVIVPVLQRGGLTPILGYLLAGVVVGPYGLAQVTDEVFGVPTTLFAISDAEGVRAIAELGVVFLLFLIGLELSTARLWAMRRLVFGLGGAQVLVTAAVLTGAARLAGLGPEAALAVGAAMALSSTAIVVAILVESGRLAAPPGRVMFSVLLMQDIAVVPVLLVIGSLAPEESDLWLSLVLSVGAAVVIIPAILVAGRLVLGPLFRFVGARRDPDMFTAAALLVIIGTAVATHEAGLSMALGAFLAGLVFADTEFRHQLEVEIAPFKGLLLGLFFLSVGMSIDPAVLVEYPLTLFALVLGVMAIKAAVVAALCLAFRQPAAIAVEAGLMLSQVGEFSLVALVLASSTGVISPEVGRVLIIVAGVSMAITSVSARWVRTLAERIQARSATRRYASTLSESAQAGHVIIAGFGRIGRAIGDMMDAQKIPYLALDLDSRAIAAARRKGQPVHFGDARRADILMNARAKTARAVVLTMDNPSANAAVIASLRRLGATTPVVARARDQANAKELYACGADAVVLEAFEASLQMGEETLVSAGLPREAAHTVIAARRDAGLRELGQG